MGLFDSLTEGLKGVLGQVTVQDLPGMLNAALAQTPMGNLQGLADQLQSGGLGAEVQSWIGAGKNLPISADQLKEVLGSDQVKQIAQHFGIDPGGAQAAGTESAGDDRRGQPERRAACFALSMAA